MIKFESFLKDVLSPRREVRLAAEKSLEDLLISHPTDSYLALISFLDAKIEDLANLSSILILNKFFEDLKYKKVELGVFKNTFNLLAEKLTQPISTKIRVKVAEILVKFSVIQKTQLDLVLYIENCFSSTNIAVQCFGCYLVENACKSQTFSQIFLTRVEIFTGIFFEMMQNRQVEIKVSSILAFYSFLEISDEKNLHFFDRCFLKTLENIVDDPNPLIINSLAETTKLNKSIWSGKLEKLTTLSLSVIKQSNASRNVKYLLVDMLEDFIETNSETLISSVFWQDWVTIAFTLLADVEYPQDLQMWASRSEDPQEIDLCERGLDLLKAVSRLPVCQQLISQLSASHLNASHWVYQAAGIRAVVLVDSFNPVEIFSFETQNVRIQHSLLCSLQDLIESPAFETIIEKTLDFSMKILKKQYETCEIAFKMYSTSLLVLQRVFSRLIRTSFELNAGIQSRLPQVYSVLLQCLSNESTLLPALEALTFVINFSGHFFESISSDFLPGLNALLLSPVLSHGQKEVRAACIRCWGSIVESCSEIFDFSELFKELWNVKERMIDDEKGISSFWEIVPEFHDKLRERFSGFLEIVLVELGVRINLDLEIGHSFSHVIKPGFASIPLNVEGKGLYFVTMNENNVMIKIEAAKVLHQMIDYYPDSLCSHFGIIFNIISTAFNCSFSLKIPEIRENLLKILTLLPCLQSSDDLLLHFFPNLLSEWSLKKDLNSLLLMIKYTYYFLSNFSNISAMGLSYAKVYSTQLSISLNLFLKTDDFSLQSKGIKFISESICILLKSFKQSFSPLFTSDFQLSFSNFLWSPSASSEQVLSALNIFCDFVEFTGNLLVQHSSCPLLEKFIDLCYSECPKIRNSAASAVKKCIEKDFCTVNAYLNNLVPALLFILRLPGARDSFLDGSESAAACLGKIAVLAKPELFSLFAEWIPFSCDQEEAAEMHALFVKNLNLLGDPSAVLKKLKASEFLDWECRGIVEKLVSYN
jgi:hypothetical protein